jgi:thiamine-phosphate pyrophosphorylase
VLYAIIDGSVCRERGLDAVRVAQAYLRGGATVVQVRDKTAGSAPLLGLSQAVVRAAAPFGRRVIVNDRADVARLAQAAGVHVGQEDLPCDDVRQLLPADAIVGVSTHTREQIDRAITSSASYVAVGPIYRTTTKGTGYEPRGLDLVRYAAGRGKPIVAIGGITVERVPEVIAAGAWAVAVITALLAGAGDPERRAREFVNALLPSPDGEN